MSAVDFLVRLALNYLNLNKELMSAHWSHLSIGAARLKPPNIQVLKIDVFMTNKYQSQTAFHFFGTFHHKLIRRQLLLLN